MTDKEIAMEALGRLPETLSLAEITEELQVVAAIRQGQADVTAGRVRSHQEVEQLFSSWTQRWTTKNWPGLPTWFGWTRARNRLSTYLPHFLRGC